MTKLETLEKSVSELRAEELAAFSEWFETLQARRFDTAIETDAY